MELIERYTVSKDWMTLVLLTAFLLLVVVKLVFPERFENFTKILYTSRYFKLNQKTLTLTNSFAVLLCAVNILSVSLLLYVSLACFSLINTEDPKIIFIQIMLGYSLFFSIKCFLEKITADIFSIESTIEPYLFYKITHRNFLALLLLPINILLIYAFPPSFAIMVVILAVTTMLNMLMLADFYRKKRKQLFSNWFYFILYLCAFEIAPYFILYKVITIA